MFSNVAAPSVWAEPNPTLWNRLSPLVVWRSSHLIFYVMPEEYGEDLLVSDTNFLEGGEFGV
jgi:hypothetical protein